MLKMEFEYKKRSLLQKKLQRPLGLDISFETSSNYNDLINQNDDLGILANRR